MTQPHPDITVPLDGPLRLGVIYNEHSGKHKKRWGTPQLPADMPTIAARKPDEVGAALKQMAEHGVTLLAIAGGDGTIQAALTHLMAGEKIFPRLPLLALMPTGSTNMTGSDVGLVSPQGDVWQRLQAWAAAPNNLQQRVARRPVLKIEPGGDATPFCGMFFGAGAIFHAVQHTQHNLHSLGLRGDVGPGVAFMRFAKAIASRDRRYFSPVHVRVNDDAGQSVEGDEILLLASTLNRLLLNFHPFWGNEPAPVHWTTVADGAKGFLRKLPAVCRGKGAKLKVEHGYRSHNANRVELHFDGGYIVDGEFFEARSADGPVVLSSAGDAAFLNL